MLSTSSRDRSKYPAGSRPAAFALLLAWMVSLSGCHDLVAGGSERDAQLYWRSSFAEMNLWLGTPTLSGSRLFTMVQGDLVALDTRNGASLWRTTVTTPPTWTENIVPHADRLYVSGDTAVFAIDPATGAVRWTSTPDDSSSAGSENLADERALYVGTRARRVHALAHHDGHVLWSADLGPAWTELGAVQGIARSGDTLYAAVTRFLDAGGLHRRGVVVALDRRDGRELWRHESGSEGGYDAAPTVSADLLLLGDIEAPAFVALDRRDGRERWRTATRPGYFGPRASPIVQGDRAYGVGQDGFAYAMRRSDGHVLWRTETGASNTHLALCGGSLLAQSQGVAVLDAARGHLRQVLFDDPDDFTSSGFVVAGRRAYAAGTMAVYAFRCG